MKYSFYLILFFCKEPVVSETIFLLSYAFGFGELSMSWFLMDVTLLPFSKSAHFTRVSFLLSKIA